MRPTSLDDLLEECRTNNARLTLTPNHELLYKSKDLNETITLNTSLVAAEPNCLVLSLTEKQADQKIVTHIAKLEGTWRLNSKNQITFELEKESGKRDILTFTSGWKINDAYQIIYSYEETTLKTKTKKQQELLFKGYWDISEKNRLTYYIGGDSSNAFKFKGAFQTKSILAKTGEIRYQLGFEIEGKSKIKEISLFGKWIVSKDFSLSFEIQYPDNQKKIICFGGSYSLSSDTEICVDLKSQQGKPLGIQLVITKDFFGKDGQAFIQLSKSVEESRIEAGVKIKF